MSKYVANASNMKIATGLYYNHVYQWVSIRVKFTRLDVATQTVQFDYLGTAGGSSVKNAIVIGDSPGVDQDNEVVVYNKTSNTTYEIYLQIDSATTIDVEIWHKGSTIDEHFATLTTGAINETGLTMVYNSGTHADFSLRDKNVIISDDTIYSGLLNYGDTQSILIDSGVSGGVGTITADTTYTPPPGVLGDVVCKFQNNIGGEAVTNNFAPPGLTCSTGDVFTFGVWALATQNVGMEFFVNPAGPGGAVVGWQVIGDGNWRFYQKPVTVVSGASNTTAFFRVDNNTGGSAVYLTGASIRKNPVAPSNTLLPYTPRYSPISGKGTVLATRNLIAKEAAIKTLTGAVDIGAGLPGGGGLLITKEGYVQPGDINRFIAIGHAGYYPYNDALTGNYIFQAVYDAYRSGGQTGGTMVNVFQYRVQVVRMGSLISIRGYLPSRQSGSGNLNYRFTWAELGCDQQRNVTTVMNQSVSTHPNASWSSSVGSDATYLTLTSTGQITTNIDPNYVNYNHLIYLLDVSHINSY
jgi:hypothetical protein